LAGRLLEEPDAAAAERASDLYLAFRDRNFSHVFQMENSMTTKRENTTR
jgi:hypothetical protein